MSKSLPLDREHIEAIEKRYREEVIPMLAATTKRDCGCVVLTHSCRVLSQCWMHATRLYR